MGQGKLPYHTSSDPSASLYAPEMTGVGRVNNRLRRRMNRKRNTSNIVKRPSDMREGMFSALAVVQEGLDETARSLADAATKEHARRGISGAVGGILREMPSTLLFRPVIVATAATTNMLEGVKNQVVPDARQDEDDKWKN